MLPARRLSILLTAILLLAGGCSTVSRWATPSGRLTFPTKPLRITPEGRYYDVHGTGKADFAILADETGMLNILAYDDNGTGVWNRTCRLSDYDPAEVPHLIVLLDSIPYAIAMKRYQAGEWRWFHPPVKVIPPFPSLTAIIYNEVLQGPPLPSTVEHYYDRSANRVENLWREMIFDGYRYPWSLRTDSMLLNPIDVGMMYMNPTSWYEYELAGCKMAADNSPNRVSIAYVAGSAGLACAMGEEGINRALDRVEQLCMQLLYERRGAIKISILSDHGHNMMRTVSVDWEQVLRAAGFNPKDHIKDPDRDVVLELSGVVTYFGVHTRRPKAVADALLRRPELELAMYEEGERVMVRSATESASIERRGQRFRYTPIEGDVLGYKSLLSQWTQNGQADADGFVDDTVWFAATADLPWPDAPRRVWDAFHGVVRNGADVLLTVKDGFAGGIPAFKDIPMASTHGGLNALNSDAVLLTMVKPLAGPLRSRQVMPLIEPRYSAYYPPRGKAGN